MSLAFLFKDSLDMSQRLSVSNLLQNGSLGRVPFLSVLVYLKR